MAALATLNTLINSFRTDGRISGDEIQDLFQCVYDILQSNDTSNLITQWSAGLTYDTPATSETSGLPAYTEFDDKFWKSLTDNNQNNEPAEDGNWTEVSKSEAVLFPEWSAGIYGEGLIIVFYNDNFYKLQNATRPYESVNIDTEIVAGDWIIVGGGGTGTFTSLQVDSPGEYAALVAAATAIGTSLDDTNLVVADGITNAQGFAERIDKVISHSGATNIIYGGIESIVGGIGVGDTVDITPGAACIVNNTDPVNPTFLFPVWTQKNGLTLDSLVSGTTYWYVDDETDTIKQTTTAPTEETRRTRAYLFRTIYDVGQGAIIGKGSEKTFNQQLAAQFREFVHIFGQLKINGIEVAFSGTNLTFRITAGTIHGYGDNENNPLNPHTKSVPVFDTNTVDTAILVTSAGVINPSVTDIDVGNYQVSGVVTSIPNPNSNTGVHYVWLFPESGNRVLSYDNDYYDDSDLAIASLSYDRALASAFAGFDQALCVGAIVAAKTATDLQADGQFISTDLFGRFTSGAGATTGATFATLSGNATDNASLLAELNNKEDNKPTIIVTDLPLTQDEVINYSAGNLTVGGVSYPISTDQGAKVLITQSVGNVFMLTYTGFDPNGTLGFTSGSQFPEGSKYAYIYRFSDGIHISIPGISVAALVAPIASNVAFTGVSTEGQTFVGTHDYTANDGGAQSGSIFKWYRADDAAGLNEVEIVGASLSNYLLVAADVGKVIRRSVRASDGNLTGIEVFSLYSTVISAAAANNFAALFDGTITGQLAINPPFASTNALVSVAFSMKTTNNSGTAMIIFGSANPWSNVRIVNGLFRFQDTGEIGTTNIADGLWHDVLIEIDPTAPLKRVTIDGNMEIENAVATFSYGWPTTTYIGRWVSADAFKFLGSLDNIVITNPNDTYTLDYQFETGTGLTEVNADVGAPAGSDFNFNLNGQPADSQWETL